MLAVAGEFFFERHQMMLPRLLLAALCVAPLLAQTKPLPSPVPRAFTAVQHTETAVTLVTSPAPKGNKTGAAALEPVDALSSEGGEAVTLGEGDAHAVPASASPANFWNVANDLLSLTIGSGVITDQAAMLFPIDPTAIPADVALAAAVVPALDGSTCQTAMPIVLMPNASRYVHNLCIIPGTTNNSFSCGTPEDCAQEYFYRVSLEFGDQWGPYNAVWVGAKACGQRTTVSLLPECNHWRSTGAHCGGMVVKKVPNSFEGVIIGVSHRQGPCCNQRDASGRCLCCFDLSINAVAWLPPASPPRRCC